MSTRTRPARRCLVLDDVSDEQLALLVQEGQLHAVEAQALRELHAQLARPGSVTVGGPPRGARWARRAPALVAAPVQGCGYPGRPGKRDDQADEDGNPLPASKGTQANWTHLTNRDAIRAWHGARLLQRDVLVYELRDAWHVRVVDGWGQLVTDHPIEPRDLDTARATAREVWRRLRAEAATNPLVRLA